MYENSTTSTKVKSNWQTDTIVVQFKGWAVAKVNSIQKSSDWNGDKYGNIVTTVGLYAHSYDKRNTI